MTLTALDLFCGAGGLTRGLLNAGFNVVGAIDNWEPALESYRKNFPDHSSWSFDISSIETATLADLGLPSQIDLVAGGPPCQGFSHQRIGPDEDPRNALVLAFGKTVIAANARAFLMENVTGLLGARGRNTVRNFRDMMSNAGYEIRSAVLDAADFGVPQSRRRVFFVGWKHGALRSFTFPEPTVGRPRTVREALEGLPSPNGRAEASDPLHRRINLSALNLQRLQHIPPGGGFEDLPIELRVSAHKNGPSRIGHRAVYGRLHPDKPAGTITGRFDSFTRGRFAHPLEDRNITLREGARLQGFSDDHVFLGTQEEIAAQIGNAIPPLLARTVAEAIASAFSSETVDHVLQTLPPFAAAE